MPSFFRWTLQSGAVLRFEHVTLRFNSLPMFRVAGAAAGERTPLARVELHHCRLETLLCNTGSPLMAIAAVPDPSRISEVRPCLLCSFALHRPWLSGHRASPQWRRR